MNVNDIGLWLAFAIIFSVVGGLVAGLLMMAMKQTMVKAVQAAGKTFIALIMLFMAIFTLIATVKGM